MNIWFAIPSVRPPEEAIPVLQEWSKRGYNIALVRQGKMLSNEDIPNLRLQIYAKEYKGWANSINLLTKCILKCDPKARWIVTGGDDLLPDSRQAEEIGMLCENYFSHRATVEIKRFTQFVPPHDREFGVCRESYGPTYGVMQPTGDRYGTSGGSDIDTAAASPWMGREFCEKVYGGRGPLWSEYFHYYADAELQAKAIALRCFEQFVGITQEHKHWSRSVDYCPPYMEEPSLRAEQDRQTFLRRQALGFPND